MNKNLIIGITGTNGSGKGEISRILVEKHGFTHISFRTFFEIELKKKNLPIDRDTMRDFANQLRREKGGVYILDQLLVLAQQSEKPAVVESIRAPEEIDFLKLKEIPVIAVDAPQELRYQRICARASETDKVDYETFCRQELLESQSKNPAEQNLVYCMKHANITIRNESDLETLEREVDDVLRFIDQRNRT